MAKVREGPLTSKSKHAPNYRLWAVLGVVCRSLVGAPLLAYERQDKIAQETDQFIARVVPGLDDKSESGNKI